MVDWTQVLVMAVVGLPATITAAGAVYLSWRNSYKIDDNTELTKIGSTVAINNAHLAATTASIAAKKTDQVLEQLNGVLDAKIRNVVKESLEPLTIAFKAHTNQDAVNMEEIRQALGDLKDRK
jgi:hypothetical protein